MLAPAVWAAVPAVQNIADGLPVAGPSQQMGGGGNIAANGSNTRTSHGQPSVNGGPSGQDEVSSSLIRYLETNQGSAKYLVAVPSSNQADSITLATNKGSWPLAVFRGVTLF